MNASSQFESVDTAESSDSENPNAERPSDEFKPGASTLKCMFVIES